jgi:hypothetical protein
VGVEQAGAVLRVGGCDNASSVDKAPTFAAGKPSQMLAGPYLLTLPPGVGTVRMYDVSGNGQRVLMIKESGGAGEPPPSARIILVQNWFEELKQRVNQTLEHFG